MTRAPCACAKPRPMRTPAGGWACIRCDGAIHPGEAAAAITPPLDTPSPVRLPGDQHGGAAR